MRPFPGRYCLMWRLTSWYATNGYKLLKGFCGGFLRVGGKIYTQHIKIVLRGV